MNKNLKIFLKILISAGLLGWLVFTINWSEVWAHLITIDLWKLSGYAFLILIGIGISAYKWQLLAQNKGIKHTFGDYYRFYLIGIFINNFMPSFIGGDTFKAYQTGRSEKKYIEAASSVVADRVTGLISITILALLFSLLNLKTVLNSNLLILVNVILLISLLLDIVIAKAHNFPLWKKFLDKIPQKIAQLIFEVQGYSNHSGILTKTIILGALFQFVGVALANLLLFWALEIHINFLDYLSVIFLISLISAIPISINNIGVKEWAYVTFFGIFGLSSSAVITVAILSRIIQMIISFFALPAYLKNR